MTFYKTLRPDLKSFYDGSTVWTPGQVMRPIDGPIGQACGPGYHLAKSPEEAINHGRFPFRLWTAEPSGKLLGEDDKKARFQSARIVKELPKPKWAKQTEKFIASIPTVKYFSASGKVSRKWRMYDSRDAAGAAAGAAARAAARAAAGAAARDAAGAAAGDAAWAAAWAAAGAAAGDAALVAEMEICGDLSIPKKHRAHARARWRVWQAGYGLLCDVDGVLYCYRKP